MGLMEMVVAIVAIVTLGGVMRAKAKGQGKSAHRGSQADARAMQTEMRALKERVAVLERLATDDGARLTHEIERLRDRDRV